MADEIIAEYRLLSACYKVDVVEVRRLLLQVKNPADIRDSSVWDKKTLLHYSCRYGWLDVSRRLVEQYHCDLGSRDLLGNTPLHEACGKGHVDIVRYLVGKQGCSTTCQNKDGNTPLHVACCEGYVDIVRYLVSEQGCSITCQNKDGNTPLHVACFQRRLAMVEILLASKNSHAASKFRNNNDKTLLHYSCCHGWLGITKTLVEQYHCDPESGDKDGDTPLHKACCEGHLDIVSYLVNEQGCSTACQNKDGDTPLHVACREDRVYIMRYLVSEQGCSTVCQNVLGDTPLHVACREGYIDIVRDLVSEYGCTTACQNVGGDTPLHKACRDGRLAMVEILLNGQNCSIACKSKNKNDKSLLHYSCRHGWLDVTRRLVELYHCDSECGDGQGNTPLHEACHKGHVDIVKYLVGEQGCSIACQNKDGDTPLHVVCHEGHFDIVSYLVSEQRCNITCQNKESDTPLHIACREGYLDILKALAGGQDCKAAFNCQNKDGDTPLHVACSEGYVDIVRYLVSECECSTAGQNEVGGTPLHEACREGHLAVVKALTSGQDYKAACICQNKNGDTSLHEACRKGHMDIVRYLASEQECSTAGQNENGDTALHVACREGHVDIVRYLVGECGCSTAYQNKWGDTPLHVACYKGHVDIVKYLVNEQGCSTACQNPFGDTPLHVACTYRHLAMVKALTSGWNYKEACTHQNKDGDTPLHVACHVGHVDIVRYLVSERGCNTTLQNKDGDTLLHKACRKGHLAMVKALTSGQDCKAACNCQNKKGDTPLHVACTYRHLAMVKALTSGWNYKEACTHQNKDGDTPLHVACHVDIVRYLVSEQGCNTTLQNKDGDTLLHKACRKGHLAMVKALTSGQDCKAACNCQNKKGDTPLHVAFRMGHVDIVWYLVSEQECSTVSQNRDGDILLHMACREGHLTMVKVLTSGQDYKGACSCQNNDGDTPLHVAFRMGHVDIVWYLVSEGECCTACQSNRDDTSLHEACNRHADIVRYLVSEQGYSTVSRNKDGDILLHMACREGHQAMVKALTSGRDYKAASNSQNKRGNTPLHVACREGHVDIVRYLVGECGCSTAYQNKWGDTPLHVACREGHVDIVRYLVGECGCSTAYQNKWGDTPLHVACYKGHVDIVKYLVNEQGCSTACQNNDGDTALHVACCEGHVDIVRYLVSEQGYSTVRQNKDGDIPLHIACREGHLAMVKALTSGQDCKAACNCPNKKGDTPLHEACRMHVDIVRYLVSEQECSTTLQNKDGDTPLHVACRRDRTGVIQFLLSTGRVDPWCKNASNQTPLQLTFDYTISKLFALFAGLTKVKLHAAIRVFIFGNPAAGKSTLVKVIENKVNSRFGALAGQFRNVSGEELNTAGINTVTIQNSRLGTVTIYDLAGQFEYYSSHDALVKNLMSSSVAIFIAVVKLSESEAEVIWTLRYWISFIENCCSRVEATAHLMVVASWKDKVKEAGENIDEKWSKIKKACIASSSPLQFIGFTSLDCRKLASGGLDKICDMIGSSCTALREAAEQKEIIYPHLLHAFISIKLSSEVACSVGELCTLIAAEDDSLLLTEPNLLSPLLSTLSDGGHLLYLPNKEDFEAGWVVINKQVVLSEINGTVFAPEKFKQHHDIATSTGVVPKSKIACVFAEKYNTDMILCVLTLFEFCQKIKDSFTLSLIASSDPSRDGVAAVTTSDECSESYYFFPALVRVEHPTDVWQSSGPGYQCGWCLQCSKEGQYLTPRFLHVLLLRLAFSFALAPDSSQQEAASPVLRRRCAIWKNGIQWRDRDDVQARVEVVEQNQTVLLSMYCPEKRAMACVKLRSSLIAMILNCLKEQCPAVSTSECLIDPSHLSQHQLGSTKELITYSMTDVIKAVQEGKPCALDRTGERSLDLEIALHFEPYCGMHKKLIDKLFDKDFTNREVDDVFLNDLAASIYPKLMQQVPIETVLRMFNISDGRLFYNCCDQFPDERDNPIMRCFRLLLTWKNCDTGGSTYQSLRTTLDKYSIFCGRNPVSDHMY